jgi:hypothetical protein
MIVNALLSLYRLIIIFIPIAFQMYVSCYHDANCLREVNFFSVFIILNTCSTRAREETCARCMAGLHDDHYLYPLHFKYMYVSCYHDANCLCEVNFFLYSLF